VVAFERRGYHAARVDDIVNLAKTSHGTFYLYFANKEDLFRVLLHDVAAEMKTLAASLGPVGPGRAGYEELRRWLAEFFELYSRYHPVIRAWMEPEADPEVAQLGAETLAAFAGALEKRIVVAGAPPEADPAIAALGLVATIERLGYYVETGSVAVDRESVLDTLAAVYHVGVFGGARRHSTRGHSTRGHTTRGPSTRSPSTRGPSTRGHGARDQSR